MEDQILYDLIVHEEWTRDPIVLNEVDECFWQHRGPLFNKLWKVTQGSVSYMVKTLKTQFRYQTSFGCPPQQLITLQNSRLSWDLSISSDGTLVAILQDDNVEIRTVSDNFSSTVGSFTIDKDGLSQWRKIAWSERNTLLAVSNSFGDVHIFHLRGEQKCVIPQSQLPGLNVPGKLSQAVAFLKFVPCRDEEWDTLLYVVTYQGYLNCYYLRENSSSYKKKCSLSFVQYHPYGISSMVFDHKNQLLIAAGNYGKEPYLSDEEPCYASHCNVSVWRLISDSPHFALVEDQGNALKKHSTKDYLTKLVSFRMKEDGYLKHGIYKFHLSPDSSKLITLHLDGRISFWDVPSFKLAKTWHKSEQPGLLNQDDSVEFSSSPSKYDDFMSNVVDMNWWSDEELVLATGSGAITISSQETLENLLGDSPESFEPWPSISQSVDGHILVLECEKAINTPGEKQTPTSKKWLSEKDEEEFYSIRSRLKEVTKQVLYFLTDAERFLPAVKPPQILTNTYRLLCLKSTTPEELFVRKIDLEHYGDALDLAQRFNLNTDPVFQRQWRKKPVTRISIHDYLTKIRDRYWVLDECLLRIPEDFDSTEQLLKYGLLGTSWEILHAIDDVEEKDEELKFIITPTPADVDPNDEEANEQKFTGKLSPKQIRLCKYRWQLLQYLDRLSTYEVILSGTSKIMPGDSFKAREKFSAKYFSHFRSCNIVHQSLEYARDEDVAALEHLFSYYGKYILPHWLPVLSNFPETADVDELDNLIPEIGETADDPEILPWHEMFHRDLDWVEQPNILEQIQGKVIEQDFGEFIYDYQPELKKFRNCESKDVLKDWFVKRIYEIEEMSKQVYKCCELLELARIRGIDGLDTLKSDLETLRVLSYDVNIDASLSLEELTAMSDLSKLKALMSKSTEVSFVGDFQKFVMPHLNKIGMRSMKLKNALLHEFLTDIAKTDLTCCFKLFSKCSPMVNEPIIPDLALFMKLAMDCILICKRDDQLDLVFSIVECLPNREEGVLSKQIEDLHNRLDQLELVLGAAEILECHKHPQTIDYIQDTKGKAEVGEAVIKQLIKNTSEKCPVATPAQWNTLLDHLVKLVKDTYTCIDVKHCHQLFVHGLLQSGSKQNIKMSEELLTPSRHGSLVKTKDQHMRSALYILKYDVSVNLVVESATEYFNAAVSLDDSSMDLARLCLSLIRDKPNVIQEEIDLIESLSLLQDFNTSMLPLQVRLHPDKLEIIDMCLNEKESNYKKYEKIMLLGNLLKICGEDEKERNGEIRIKIADNAFEQKDYSFCSNVCNQLMEDRYKRAWVVCKKLGECSSYSNCISREKLLSFAMTFCPISELESVLNANTLLKTQVLYDQLRVHVNADLDEDEQDLVDGQSLVKATTKKTMRLLSSVKDTKWIGKAINWTHSTDSSNQQEVSDKLETGRFHTYYETVSGVKENNSTNYNFDEFSSLLLGDDEDKTKVFNELMLRSQKLSERRAEGELIEDTDEALSCLAGIEYNNESLMSLAYLMSLSSDKLVEETFSKQKKTKFMLCFAAYYYALRLYSKQHNLIGPAFASVYLIKPTVLINDVLRRIEESEGDEKKHHYAELLVMYLKQLSDMQQAEMLQGLGKGVDVHRFTSDDEYKKETILGLAMNVEDEMLNVCFELATKYNVPKWEVLLSHVEFLFTESGLKGNVIRDYLKKWDIEEELKPHGDEVFERMIKFVYPDIDGKEHSKLLLFYVFLSNCSSPSKMIEGTLNLDAHVKLLKKIKAAAQSMDYKELVHGDSPLDVISEVVRENNVHLLAKISMKIPRKDGTFLSPKKIFLAYMKKSFWNPDRGFQQIDWIHHFETYQKMLPKLDVNDLIELADHLTYREESFNLLTVDIRIDIISRLQKFVRQKMGQQNNEAKNADPSDVVTEEQANKVLNHLEISLKHLKLLQGQTFLDLVNTAKSSQQVFAKLFDLSRGDIWQIRRICTDMFKKCVSPRLIADLLLLDKQLPDAKELFNVALHELLDDFKGTSDSSDVNAFIKSIKSSIDISEEVVTLDDIFDLMRPFYTAPNVDTRMKTELLCVLKESFELPTDDEFQLTWLQTDYIISSKWDIMITSEDIDDSDKRYELYCKLLMDASSSIHTEGLEALLKAWPTQEANVNRDDETNLWLRLLLKHVELEEFELISETISTANKTGKLHPNCYKRIYTRLKDLNELETACKIMLTTDHAECSKLVFNDMFQVEDLEIDDELVKLFLDDNEFCRLAQSPIFEKFVQRLFSETNSWMVDKAIKKLQDGGLEEEAANLHKRQKGSSSGFFGLYKTFNVFKSKFT